MKNLLIILVILVVIGYFTYKKGKGYLDKINISEPKFVGANLDSLISGTGFNSIDLQSTVTNGNNFAIPVNKLYIEVFYNGSLVAKSTRSHDAFIIPKNGSATINENITLSFGTLAIPIVADIAKKRPVVFTYNVKATLFNFIPISYTDTLTYTR